MRGARITILTLLLVGGCMNYPRYRWSGYGAGGPSAVQSEVPPGKILVQDVRTGKLILIDDPNAPKPQEQARPAPQRYVEWNLPPVPHQPPRVVRVPRPRVPRPPLVGHVPRPQTPPRPKFGVSVGAWGTNLNGTVTGHAGWSQNELDVEDDLGLDGASAVSINFNLQFPRGPRFRLGIISIRTKGEVPPDKFAYPTTFPPSGIPEYPTSLGVFILDLGFCPMVREARWGAISLETGIRYARSVVEIGEEDGQFAEGVMVTLGGDLRFPLYKNLFTVDVGTSIGLGADSAFFQFDTGVGYHPTPHFWIRLGYRFLAMVLMDRMEEPDERDLSFSVGGPGLELGLKF